MTIINKISEIRNYSKWFVKLLTFVAFQALCLNCTFDWSKPLYSNDLWFLIVLSLPLIRFVFRKLQCILAILAIVAVSNAIPIEFGHYASPIYHSPLGHAPIAKALVPEPVVSRNKFIPNFSIHLICNNYYLPLLDSNCYFLFRHIQNIHSIMASKIHTRVISNHKPKNVMVMLWKDNIHWLNQMDQCVPLIIQPTIIMGKLFNFLIKSISLNPNLKR